MFKRKCLGVYICMNLKEKTAQLKPTKKICDLILIIIIIQFNSIQFNTIQYIYIYNSYDKHYIHTPEHIHFCDVLK